MNTDWVTALNNTWWGALLLFGFLIWSFAWKGIALWKAARNGGTVWFVVLLLLNTMGILEILYVFVFANLGKKKAE